MTLVTVLAFIAAASSLVTAGGVMWLCGTTRSTRQFFVSAADRDEAETMRDVTIVDSLLRIEEAATDARAAAEAAKVAATKVAARVDVVAELGFQNAEGQHRMEDADALVAGDLAGSIARADALPKDGNYGAAADAALRSGDEA